jgi:hypothetical protein
MGVPMCLAHTKYQRNALLFNMGFVLDAEDLLLPIYRASIEQCLFKLSNYLTNFEKESEYLIKQTNNSSNITSRTSRWASDGDTRSHYPVYFGADIAQHYASYDKGIIPGFDKARSLLVVMRELHERLNSELSASVPVDDVNAARTKIL